MASSSKLVSVPTTSGIAVCLRTLHTQQPGFKFKLWAQCMDFFRLFGKPAIQPMTAEQYRQASRERREKEREDQRLKASLARRARLEEERAWLLERLKELGGEYVDFHRSFLDVGLENAELRKRIAALTSLIVDFSSAPGMRSALSQHRRRGHIRWNDDLIKGPAHPGVR